MAQGSGLVAVLDVEMDAFGGVTRRLRHNKLTREEGMETANSDNQSLKSHG